MIDEKGPWILTASGRQFHYLENDPDELHMPDMIRAMSRDCRYGGHLSDAHEDSIYSVAQHSVYVLWYLMETGAPTTTWPWGVTHDCPEGYWRDQMAPLKVVLTEYAPLENRTAAIMRKKYGIPYNEDIAATVHHADMQLYYAEREVLTSPTTIDDVPKPHLSLTDIDPDFYLWGPKKAKEELTKAIDQSFLHTKR